MNTLKEYEIVSDISRLDHPEYFQQDFSCADLDKFFSNLNSTEKVYDNKQPINYFFSRMFDFQGSDKTLYVRLKWLLYLHSIIQGFYPTSIMYGFTQKALEIYQDEIEKLQQKQNNYEKYLFKKLFKPYLRFLYKLCSLKNQQQQQRAEVRDEDEDKQNKENRGNSIIKKLQQKQNKQMLQWYRMYNFVVQTVETFDRILFEIKPFFSCEYPYLNKMSKSILTDIKSFMTMLKKEYKKLNKLRVTSLELDKLNSKVMQFYETSHDSLKENGEILPDFAKQDISDFLLSPLKPSVSALNKNKKPSSQLTIPIQQVKSSETQEAEQENQ